jgi:pterin-4a-carbinolamine dehydratase
MTLRGFDPARARGAIRRELADADFARALGFMVPAAQAAAQAAHRLGGSKACNRGHVPPSAHDGSGLTQRDPSAAQGADATAAQRPAGHGER